MIRLLALLGGLSTATDLGAGAPMEESVKRAVVAYRLARSLGCPDTQVREVLYASLLLHLGCTAFAHELADVFGDDAGVIRAAFAADGHNQPAALGNFVSLVAEATGRTRAGIMVTMLTSGRRVDRQAPIATCEVARDAARRLALPSGVEHDLAHVTAQWDGRGYPPVGGADIPLPTRVMHVASVATLVCLRDGPASALEVVRRRAGAELDPDVAAALTESHLSDLEALDGQDTMLDCEPDPVLRVDTPDVERVAEVFGNLADLKSPWLHGHSAAVAATAGAAATRLGLSEAKAATLRIAGHLHDLGRMGVSSRIWDKMGSLSAAERAQVELHPWHTERTLAGVPELAEVAGIARAHHERLNGSGYHRQAIAAQLSQPARVLAAADRYRTLREDRPHRKALAEGAAAEMLRRDVAEGLLDSDAVAAVLADPAYARRRARPAGLTDRQVTVLRLVAAGRSNRDIAGELVISQRTAEHHVQDVYARIGVSSRAAAALFAMEHGMLPEGG